MLILAPADLIASKVIAYHARRGQLKSWTDRRDLAALLLRFPKLKRATGPVRDRLTAAGAGDAILAAWEAIVAEGIVREKDEGY